MTPEEARTVVRDYLTELERVFALPLIERGRGDHVLLSERFAIAQCVLLLEGSE